MTPFSGLPRVLFSGAILAILLFLLPKSNPLVVLLGTIASIGVYILLLRFTGYITQEDIDLLKTARNQS